MKLSQFLLILLACCVTVTTQIAAANSCPAGTQSVYFRNETYNSQIDKYDPPAPRDVIAHYTKADGKRHSHRLSSSAVITRCINISQPVGLSPVGNTTAPTTHVIYSGNTNNIKCHIVWNLPHHHRVLCKDWLPTPSAKTVSS